MTPRARPATRMLPTAATSSQAHQRSSPPKAKAVCRRGDTWSAGGPYTPFRQPGRLIVAPLVTVPGSHGSTVPLGGVECAIGMPFGDVEWHSISLTTAHLLISMPLGGAQCTVCVLFGDAKWHVYGTARLRGHRRRKWRRTVTWRPWDLSHAAILDAIL